MSEGRKAPICSHCLEPGHTKASRDCPLRGKEPAPRIEKEPAVNRWTAEKELLLLRLIKQGPLKPDWEKIAEVIGQAATGCKSKYIDLVSPTEQVQALSKRISLSDITSALSDKRNICATCKGVFYIPLYEWQGVQKCPSCYSAHQAEQDVLWAQIEPYAHCLFCKRGRSSGIPLNFDHINMFDKEDSVCSMVRRGAPIEEILKEVTRCQVLCKSCHAVVTEVENQVGFRRAKTNLTRSANGTLKDGKLISPEEASELQAEYQALYKETIERLYPLIKQLVGGS